ncbi:MAG: c-type cytochrome biogenesis protein CcmI [Beijerinckiaceae bacterium]|nr:MAG: c-type cytochrome biogenesis protein CcmI [Beijerinckiaceae bacterium]
MVWLIFAVLSAAAVISVLWPLAKTPRGVARREIGIAIYKAQLAEIERDEAQRLVAPEDAQGAKAEAARRLIAADAANAPLPAASKTRARLASAGVLIFVPVLALSLYATIGHPDMPDAPLAARLDASPARMDLAAAIAKIEAHLAQHPDDGRGYEVLAPVYLRLGRAGDAVSAARAALRLLGETPARHALYGEALVAAANGVVTAESKQSFEAAAARDPSAAEPRFFLGLAAEQEGDIARARDIWGKLAAEAPRDMPWAQALRERLAALGAGPETTQEGLAAKIEALPEAGQMTAIRGMVEGLAARLAQNGQDVEGWLRLVRSYTVLQEPNKARSALIDAKRSLAGDPSAIARIEALARELGLEG